MKRREAVKYTSTILGVSMSSTFIASFLGSCKPIKKGNDYLNLILDNDSLGFLKALSDVIIPETHTPGAISLGVPEWIDSLIAKCLSKNDQENYINEISLLAKEIDKSGAFTNGTNETRMKIVGELESINDDSSEIKKAYKSIRGLIAMTYLGTEYVGTNLLVYDPIPGEYQPCISLSLTDGKAWADV